MLATPLSAAASPSVTLNILNEAGPSGVLMLRRDTLSVEFVVDDLLLESDRRDRIRLVRVSDGTVVAKGRRGHGALSGTLIVGTVSIWPQGPWALGEMRVEYASFQTGLIWSVAPTPVTVLSDPSLVDLFGRVATLEATASVPGPAGAQGAPGADGAPGSPGADGTPGPQGPTGATGPAGPAGPAGTQGMVGAMGPAGPAGVDGAPGAQGPAGAAGSAGSDGAPGLAGADGQSVVGLSLGMGHPQCSAGGAEFLAASGSVFVCNGNDGMDGPQGASGADGSPGRPGVPGADGQDGAVGPQGTPGVDGLQGLIGATGAAGAPGSAGVVARPPAPIGLSDVGLPFTGARFPSITVPPDGLPVIAFYDLDRLGIGLFVWKCSTPQCVESNPQITFVDSGRALGQTSITFDRHGLPVIAYSVGSSLRVAECLDAACLTSTVTDLGLGQQPSLTVAPDGTPLVAYYSGGLKLAYWRCRVDGRCSYDASTHVTASGGTGNTSITLGVSGFPIIGYFSGPNAGLVYCDNLHCTSSSIHPQGAGRSVSVSVDVSGVVVFSIVRSTNLLLYRCGAPTSCGAATFVYRGIGVPGDAMVSIGRDGFALVAYPDVANDVVRIDRCRTLDCSVVSSTSFGSGSGSSISLSVSSDGRPMVAFENNSSGSSIRVAGCPNSVCLPHWRPR